MQIDFDAEKHVYTVDGVIAPSVTELCAPLGADYDDPTDDFLDTAVDIAAERGLTLHSYIEHRLKGGDREDFEMPSIYETYAEGVELFLAEHEITPYAIETPIAVNRLHSLVEDFDFPIAGTPDLTCSFDGEDAILDWKFVSQIAKSKVAAQLGGYKEISEDNGFFPTRLVAVQFLPGTYRLYEISPLFALHAFKAVCKVYKLKKFKHPRGRIGDKNG